MIYLTNFISNIKRICINIKYVLCYDLHKLFNNINSKANDNSSRIDGIIYSDLIDVDYKFKKAIKKIYQKLEKYQVSDIDMMKIYIEENEERIKKLEDYLNTLTKHNVFKDIQYPLNKRIEELEARINAYVLNNRVD